MRRRFFYDTEFREEGPDSPIEFISIGIVRDDGAEYYAVSSEFDVEAVLQHTWLRENVWPYLPQVEAGTGKWFNQLGTAQASKRGWNVWLDLDHPSVKPRRRIATEIAHFVLAEPNPQLWAYYPSYDHVVMCQLFGTMMDLPRGFPMRTRDLMDLVEDGGHVLADLPQKENEHKAIDDARWNREIFRAMTGE
jgi:hypothetical protein